MTQSSSRGTPSCLTALVLIVFVLAAVTGLLSGLFALSGDMSPAGITFMNIFMTPLFLYLLVGGLRDLGKKTGTGRWFRLASSGAMLALMVGAGAFNAIRLGTCGQRLVAGGNLNGCNFSGDDLSGLDLHGADLAFANFSGSDLTGTNLAGAHFNDTDLTGAFGLSDETLARFLGIGLDDLAAATAQQGIRLESRTHLQLALGGVCAGQGVDGARINADEQSFHTMMVLDPDGHPSSDWSNVPVLKGWEPTALRFTDLVACISDQEKVAVQTCDYVGGSDITRYGYEVHARLFDAATGRLVAEQSIRGASPDACPQSAPASQSTIYGDYVEKDDVTGWLAKWVHAPEE